MYIRKIENLDEIFKLLIKFADSFTRELNTRVGDLSAYAKKLKDSAYVYVAEDNGNRIGMIAFYANDQINNIAYLTLISVEKEFHKMGIGEALLKKCVEISKKQCMSEIRLEVDNDNRNAIAFYKKIGFQELESFSEVSKIMRKVI